MASTPRVFPTHIIRSGPAQLVIQWSDGQRRLYTAEQLRRDCPCATCETSRGQPISADGTESPSGAPLVIGGMSPVGNYAYRVTFSDGHTTGIYPMELLHGLGERIKDEG
jgi:DUF971 family protein